MSREQEIWKEVGLNPDDYSLTVRLVMNEYAKEVAKQESIEFAKFRDEYKKNEYREVMKEQERLGGIFTWIGTSDEEIYKAFQQSKSTA